MDSPPRLIGIVGLGYVGLPLLLAYARQGCHVLGFDIDPAKIALLLEGQSYIKHIPALEIRSARERGHFDVTTDHARISEVDAVILCLPTPLGRHHTPDLSCVRDTLDAIVPHLKSGTIVSLESTTYPGTTEEEVVPRVLARGLVPGESVFIVYSPDREDPGNATYSTHNIPKLVGGLTPACLAAGVSLYEPVFDTVVPVSSCRVAELSKLLENIYRAVNIGLVNEMKMVADAMGIDIWEVIAAAATKPFGFTPFYPGPGLGGHCIPIDPFYLTWKAKEFGVHTRFIELAGQVNCAMPEYVVQRTIHALSQKQKPLRGSKVLLLGLAYKPDVDDTRESPAFELMDRFAALGAEVVYYDPHIPTIGLTREHADWAGTTSVPWEKEVFSRQDVVVIATAHRACDYEQLSSWASLIVDTRHAMAGIEGGATVVRA